MSGKRRQPQPDKWSDSYYVRCYRYARDGYPDRDMAKLLGVDETTFTEWKRVLPALKEALELARNPADTSFRDYVYERMTPRLQELFDRIVSYGEGDAGDRIDAILENEGEGIKQHLFLHALVYSKWNKSKALSMMNLKASDLRKWVDADPDFGEMIYGEIQFHKKNFAEGALFHRIGDGDTAAIIYANKTLNRDRGYGDSLEVKVKGKQKVEHSGTVEHKLIDLSELELSPTLAYELYLALKKLEEKQAAKRLPAVPVPVQAWTPDGLGVPVVEMEEMPTEEDV